LVPASTKIGNVQNFLRKKLQLKSDAQVTNYFIICHYHYTVNPIWAGHFSIELCVHCTNA